MADFFIWFQRLNGYQARLSGREQLYSGRCDLDHAGLAEGAAQEMLPSTAGSTRYPPPPGPRSDRR